MKLRFAPRALAEAKRKKTWWLKNRQAAPELFEEELATTLQAVLEAPSRGTPYEAHFAVSVRRVLMPRTRNHIYFAVVEDELIVLSVWGAQRARGPKL